MANNSTGVWFNASDVITAIDAELGTVNTKRSDRKTALIDKYKTIFKKTDAVEVENDLNALNPADWVRSDLAGRDRIDRLNILKMLASASVARTIDKLIFLSIDDYTLLKDSL